MSFDKERLQTISYVSNSRGKVAAVSLVRKAQIAKV
jgi:hypothetical protein